LRECPACGGMTAHTFRFRVNGCDILQCAECGLGRTETPAFDPATYYTEDYFSGRRADGYADYLGAEPVLRREFSRSVDFIRRYRNGGKLLELGCAYGFFLKEAARYFDVAGIERRACAPRGAERAARRSRRSESAADRQGRRHRSLRRHRASAAAARDAGAVPRSSQSRRHHRDHDGDYGSLAARLTGARWRLMTPPQHLWFFTQASMRRLSAALGLALEHVDHPWKIVPASLIVFQLRRMLGLRGNGLTTASRIGVPVNLFDAMRVVLRKPG
jgi:hypothetical protein